MLETIGHARWPPLSGAPSACEQAPCSSKAEWAQAGATETALAANQHRLPSPVSSLGLLERLHVAGHGALDERNAHETGNESSARSKAGGDPGILAAARAGTGVARVTLAEVVCDRRVPAVGVPRCWALKSAFLRMLAPCVHAFAVSSQRTGRLARLHKRFTCRRPCQRAWAPSGCCSWAWMFTTSPRVQPATTRVGRQAGRRTQEGRQAG